MGIWTPTKIPCGPSTRRLQQRAAYEQACLAEARNQLEVVTMARDEPHERSLRLDRRGFRSEVGEVGHRDVRDELRDVVERGQSVGVKALVGGEVWHLDSQ